MRTALRTTRTLLAATAVTLAVGLVPGQAAAAPPPGTWTAVPYPALAQPGARLHGITAPGPRTGFAVGTEDGESEPVALRRVGATWTRQALPATAPPNLVDVDARSPADAWAVGQSPDPATPRALHWNGLRWKTDPLPLPTPIAVSVDSSGRPWVAGTKGGEGDGSAVYRRTGAGWVKSLDLPPGELLDAISARTPRDVWAAGSGGGTLALHHYDGTAWRAVSYPASWPQWVLQIEQVAADDVWFYVLPMDPMFSGPNLVHWDGTAFTAHRVPRGAGGVTAAISDPGFLGDLAADGRGGVWVSRNDDGRLHHFDGAAWTSVPNPAPGQVYDLARVRGTRQVWGAGTSPSILRFR
ncbi:hypothetical protein [Actinomadura flavalba]|uniref:hypothetical protein n=1 Tax=Actinomadura flavalba TaxID=1120938 RepID=UPI00035EAC95|nr:hypothetical protein [Actinomadura flavalba]